MLIDGWQGWWTGGHYRDGIRSFVWSHDNRMIEKSQQKWLPNLVIHPFDKTCVWLVPLSEYVLGNYWCAEPSGFICEIKLWFYRPNVLLSLCLYQFVKIRIQIFLTYFVCTLFSNPSCYNWVNYWSLKNIYHDWNWIIQCMYPWKWVFSLIRKVEILPEKNKYCYCPQSFPISNSDYHQTLYVAF